MKKNFFTIIALFVAATLPAQDQLSSTPSLLTVKGSGEVRIENTLAVVQLGFESAGPDDAQVRADISGRSATGMAALKKEDVQRLRTTSINLNPQFQYHETKPGTKPQPPKITGYIGRLHITFSAPVEDAGRIISLALKLGANSLSSLLTEPTEEARRTAEDEALTLAAQDAQGQAATLLAALKLKQTAIHSINATDPSPSHRPALRSHMMMADAEKSSAPDLGIEGGESVIRREITVEVEFSPSDGM